MEVITFPASKYMMAIYIALLLENAGSYSLGLTPKLHTYLTKEYLVFNYVLSTCSTIFWSVVISNLFKNTATTQLTPNCIQ